jgi:hypothetical protein
MLELVGCGFGHRGLVEDVVMIAVVVDLVAEAAYALFGFG